MRDFHRGINLAAIRDEAETLLKPSSATNALPHSEILNTIIDTLGPMDFKAAASLSPEDTLPQKHLLVLCVNELISRVREKNLDLARKDDFIFAFNGTYWKELNKNTLEHFLGRAADRLGVNSLEAQHYKFKAEMYRQFLTSAHFDPIKPQKGSVLINLQNGTFEITKNSQRLREFCAGDFLTYQLPFSFDEDARSPTFHRFLDRVLPEKELQDIVAEFFGYVFTTGLKMEKALLLYGSGANGKSVLFDILNALIGQENISNYSLSDLLQEHNRAMIAHKLLNYGSEINATKARDEFKNLVSTEPIQARLKYANPFIMRDYAKLAFNCNDLPKDFDHLNAYFRRLLIVPFRVTIPESEQEKGLARTIIENELPGVFNWILAGLRRLLQTEKFTESEIVNETLATYRRESDSVANFISEKCYVPSAEGYELLKYLYLEYRAFCIEEGAHPLKKTNFKKRLIDHGFNLDLLNNGNRVYLEVSQ
ncbi:MAG: hypothetical protein KIS76_12790 [Pyrinomonadaceae bacterium]|nr:hypothetical protein [Pyrinomonadaceae bacterium]